jgi:hypothetical protein
MFESQHYINHKTRIKTSHELLVVEEEKAELKFSEGRLAMEYYRAIVKGMQRLEEIEEAQKSLLVYFQCMLAYGRQIHVLGSELTEELREIEKKTHAACLGVEDAIRELGCQISGRNES